MRKRIELSGDWDFHADPDGSGIYQDYPSGKGRFERRIHVPGAWQAQGVGKPQAHLAHEFVGWGWYRQQVNLPPSLAARMAALQGEIPPSFEGKRVRLVVGGATETLKAFVNGCEVGSHYGFSTPFRFDITEAARPGENLLVLAVTNLPKCGKVLPPGQHHIEDPSGCFNYLARWGGIHRPVHLEITGSTWIEDAYVVPQPSRSRVELEVETRGARMRGKLRFRVARIAHEVPLNAPGRIRFAVPMPNPRLWSPDDPFLYTGKLSLLAADGKAVDELPLRFGMREITVRGADLLLNGQPLYVNGYGDDCVEILTGVPPCDLEVFRKRLQTMKSCGFNAVRHHSWVPTEEYFWAADEVGMLVHAELPAAYAPFFLPNVDFFKQEIADILKAYRNHPSFYAIAMGNEFFHYSQEESRGIDFGQGVEELYRIAKKHFRTGLVLSNSGERMAPSDVDSPHITSGWVSPEGKPVIAHEFGGYFCTLPDLEGVRDFKGVVRPRSHEPKLEWLRDSGWQALYPRILRNSQRLLHLRRKNEIEFLRTQPNVSGYYWWLGTDYPAGTEGDAWYEGIMDFCWRPKAFQHKEMRAFNGPTVLVPRPRYGDGWGTFPIRTAWDYLGCHEDLFLSHYGKGDLRDGKLVWRITGSGGRVLASGRLQGISQPSGTVRLLTSLDIGKFGLSGPDEIRLVAHLTWKGGRVENQWSYWLFPRPTQPLSDPKVVRLHPDLPPTKLHDFYAAASSDDWRREAKVIVCDKTALAGGHFEPRLKGFLDSGGRVVFLAQGANLPCQSWLGFWPGYARSQGIFLEDHPALAPVFRRSFCDELFGRFFGGGAALFLEKLPRDYVPIAGGILAEATHLAPSQVMRKFGLLLEGRLGRGKLLVTPLRVVDGLARPTYPYFWRNTTGWPESWHFAEGLIAYALTKDFHPRHDLSPLFEK